MTKDLRRYASQTNNRLLIGFFLILLVIGLGSIYLIYGREAALTGLICIAFALIPVLLVVIVIAFLGWAARKLDE